MEQSSGLKLRAIGSSDRFDDISCGNAKFLALKVFLQRHALYYEGSNLARTYVAFDPATGAIAGYVTLVCSEIDLGDEATLHPGTVAEARERYPYTNYPAIKIARLLVDSGRREQGLGTQLVDLAFGIATQEIGPRVGCRFLIVDSKPEAVEFYKKRGFTLLDTQENRQRDALIMFVDLKGM
jgi:GNAT superfamily N-acetyltransferase